MDTDRVNEIIRENLDLDRNEPLKDVLYDCFRQTVVLGKLPAGTQINEERLSKSLHISRTPIRIALDRLAGEYLVRRVPGSGVLVLGISLRDAEEMYEIRNALEPLAFVKAAHNMADEDFEKMRLLLESGEQSNAGADVDAVVNNFGDFNEMVFSYAHMARLQGILDSIAVYLRYFRNTAIRQSDRRDIALKEHWNIYLAMRFGGDEKIVDEVKKHLLNNYRFVTKAMRSLGIS
ncbi:GntR family transcriptional regulator [uncultured Parolsenella sp.]|uniref:GntR family transcriptional regulator n=1 Tax=uncultured Parolsenella sp. TaxID=2083008 RepID=UPI0025E3560C|nr:GntR family transcriptional regulator [uncultured Parolsenella sp.]